MNPDSRPLARLRAHFSLPLAVLSVGVFAFVALDTARHGVIAAPAEVSRLLPHPDSAIPLPLPLALERVYGTLRLPRCPVRPYVVANFVATLDGVVSLGIPGQAGGGEISGFDAHDRMVMGLLRAVARAVVIGAGTLRAASPALLWTAEYICPPLAEAFQEFRSTLGITEPPLNVVVTASGEPCDSILH